MSRLIAKIKSINSIDKLHIVVFNLNNIEIKMISLDLNENIKINTKVCLQINPNSVAIGKDFTGKLSYSNQIKAKIESIELGELLCSIKLSICDFYIESIITSDSYRCMSLVVGEIVTIFIKANEVSIIEVLEC